MKTLTSTLIAALLLGCSNAPSLKFPTGENRVPVNTPRHAASPAGAASAATATPLAAAHNPEDNPTE